MKLMINHQTHYQYTDLACNSIQYIKMTPTSNLHQKCTAGMSVYGVRNVQNMMRLIIFRLPVRSANRTSK